MAMPLVVKTSTYSLAYWIVLVALIMAGDYLTGPLILFPVFYLLPIVLVAWTNGRWWGLFFAFAMPLGRVYFSLNWPVPWSISALAVNTIIRILVLAGFAVLVDMVAIQKRKLEHEIQMLRGILPICSFCKKIRDQDGHWEVLEHYISVRSDAKFSHGICPDCARQHYPDIILKKT
jgi:hypothetical protein